MRFSKLLTVGVCALGLSAGAVLSAQAGSVKVEGTRFTLNVPQGWNPGYKDTDKLFMFYVKDPSSGSALEGVYLRGQQAKTFTMGDFKKARVSGEDKRYEGKGHKVTKEGAVTVGGEKGAYLHTTWKDGGKEMEKHTALMLKDGERYLVVMSGQKGKVDKKVFDHAVSSFALVSDKKK
jgi:hypothetical protein